MRAAAWQARPGPAPASGGLARGGITPTPARPCEGTGEEGAGPAGQADRGHARRGARAARPNALVPAPPRPVSPPVRPLPRQGGRERKAQGARGGAGHARPAPLRGLGLPSSKEDVCARFTAHEAQRPGQRAAAAALPSGSCRAEGVAPQGALGGGPSVRAGDRDAGAEPPRDRRPE